MADLFYQQVVWTQQQKEEINQVEENFREILSTCTTNTLFQLLHYDLIERGIELSDYVFAGDWSNTVLKKIKEYIEDVTKILQSDKFKNDQKVIQLVAKIVSMDKRGDK